MTGLVVTGLGLVTPGGVGTEAGWAAVRDGRSTTALDPALAGAPVRLSCRVPDFDADTPAGSPIAVCRDHLPHHQIGANRRIQPRIVFT